MFSKILIANRGEIALRIIRAARELGLKTVAVYSESDRNASTPCWRTKRSASARAGPRTAISIFPTSSSAAEQTKADAIHPGYGFLAENAEVRRDLRIVRVLSSSALAGHDQAHGQQEPGAPGDEESPPLHPSGQQRDRPGPGRGQEDRQEDRLSRHPQGGGRRRRQGDAHRRAPGPSSRSSSGWPRTKPRPPSTTPPCMSKNTCSNARHIEIQVIGDKHGK